MRDTIAGKDVRPCKPQNSSTCEMGTSGDVVELPTVLYVGVLKLSPLS